MYGLQQVVRTGDVLEGSTITNVYFNGAVNSTSTVSPDRSLSGMNDVGQVAFSYTLANGNDGMAIWTKAPGVPGDYNGNGTVDAADYVLWRDTLNQSGPNLAADGSGNGVVGQEDYFLWRGHVGQMSVPAAGAISDPANDGLLAVPEPATQVFCLVGMYGVLGLRRRCDS